MRITHVTSVSYGTFSFTIRVFGGKICNVWRRQDGAGYFVSSKGIFVHKYPLILRYSDWLVLEIITLGKHSVVKREIRVVIDLF